MSLAGALLASSSLLAQEQEHLWYVRGGLGYESSRDTIVRDRQCASSAPPALFGCGPGVDDRQLAARGDFGDPSVVELGVGLVVNSRTRVELDLAQRSGLDLEANANFRGVPGAQPVRSDGRSRSALVVAAVDLGRTKWRFRPFVAGGIGAARNETGSVRYAFPSIAPQAATVVRGGAHTDFSWTVGVGASLRISPALDLELAARYTDLGELRTDPGRATIVRPTRTIELDISGTSADVETLGAFLALRYSF